MGVLYADLGSITDEMEAENIKLINCRICPKVRDKPCISKDKCCCLGTKEECLNSNNCPNNLNNKS